MNVLLNSFYVLKRIQTGKYIYFCFPLFFFLRTFLFSLYIFLFLALASFIKCDKFRALDPLCCSRAAITAVFVPHFGRKRRRREKKTIRATKSDWNQRKVKFLEVDWSMRLQQQQQQQKLGRRRRRRDIYLFMYC